MEEENAGSCKVTKADLEPSKENSKEKTKIDLLPSEDRPEIGKKNKWLHPTDNFGKMEHGVIYTASKEAYKNGKKKRK